MSGEALLFMLALVLSGVMLFGMVFYVIMLTDLESDYINPIDLCNKLNQFVLPEYLVQYLIIAAFFLTGSWIAMLLNVPIVAYNTRQLLNRKHMYDATEIFRTLPQHKKESFFKLAFYLLCFFYYLYRMILGLINDD
ncbi:ER-derived vesicles protein ERV14 [Basidiobolus meristosporus CBS 931.73]|uniref:ER-derived vesicles protein ERV14 n=1 Tax=Basidiobolus meristosporus CBS 931.73 TaxID=1314790 RepID=A0A1Y1Y6I8_9FUNG|nr:ER-derived vesicles protein ERV14 [Basidiobolus meristosporus CBS 931.73]|eukprot:ORX93598.1 ER-derived vesicles protein ERV14 [Basidiobolus meristosporus CBS 931.73]